MLTTAALTAALAELDSRIDAQALALGEIRQRLDAIRLELSQDPLPMGRGVYIPLRSHELGR